MITVGVRKYDVMKCLKWNNTMLVFLFVKDVFYGWVTD